MSGRWRIDARETFPALFHCGDKGTAGEYSGVRLNAYMLVYMDLCRSLFRYFPGFLLPPLGERIAEGFRDGDVAHRVWEVFGKSADVFVGFQFVFRKVIDGFEGIIHDLPEPFAHIEHLHFGMVFVEAVEHQTFVGSKLVTQTVEDAGGEDLVERE